LHTVPLSKIQEALMKKVRSGLFAVAATAMAVSLSAQTPPPSSDQSSARSNRDDKVTVTGCLERAKESAATTGTTGTAGASASSKFVLNNVTSAPSPSGTAGTAGAMTTASSYRLDAEDSKLTPHLGHKIEITGTVAKEASATGTSMSASAPKLKVESVKMIADSCTP
jgi:hypothetical protein